jgi:hypothetical protein
LHRSYIGAWWPITGMGGSVLVIGSAVGVAAMGMEKISFFWCLRKFSLLRLIGYFAGAIKHFSLKRKELCEVKNLP